MSNTNIDLATALGITASESETTPPISNVIPAPIDSNNRIEDDTTYARENMLSIIEQGASVIDLTIRLLEESHNPRVSESLSMLLKTQAENIDKLLKIHKDKKELDRVVAYTEGGQTQTPGAVNIDKAVIFQGTSDELVRMIRKEQNNIIGEIVHNKNE